MVSKACDFGLAYPQGAWQNQGRRTGQVVGRRGLVGNRGIERRFGHDHVRLCLSYESPAEQELLRSGAITVGAMIHTMTVFRDRFDEDFHRPKYTL